MITRKGRARSPGLPVGVSAWFMNLALVLLLTSHFSLLGLIHDFVVGLDHVFLLFLFAFAGWRAVRPGTGAARPGFGSLVQGGAGGRIRLGQLFQRLLDLVGRAGAERLLAGVDRRVQPVTVGLVQPVRPLLAVLLHVVGEGVQPVAPLDLLPACLVLAGVFFGGLDHLLDFGLGEPAGSLDPDLLL